MKVRMKRIENHNWRIDLKHQKLAVDRFWLSNIKNTTKALQVIELYYERVEEANKQFSNYKEGWKTDMGMMYILFGPPWYIENTLEQQIWRYSNDFYNPETNFTFKSYKFKNKFYPWNDFFKILICLLFSKPILAFANIIL